MIWMLRVILFLLVFFLIIFLIKTIFNSNRKLDTALKSKRYFLMDYPDRIEQNFFLAYKGALFEGEKYLGPAKDTFEVISILIWPKNVPSLKGFRREDFLFLEKKIHDQYPLAVIEWKSPVKEFLHLD